MSDTPHEPEFLWCGVEGDVEMVRAETYRTLLAERDQLQSHQELHDRIFARQKLLLDDLTLQRDQLQAQVAELEGQLEEAREQVKQMHDPLGH